VLLSVEPWVYPCANIYIERTSLQTILTSVIETRSLDDIFNFKESEKSLTMESQTFSKFSLLSPKKYKI
jgi:hypothetical protein